MSNQAYRPVSRAYVVGDAHTGYDVFVDYVGGAGRVEIYVFDSGKDTAEFDVLSTAEAYADCVKQRGYIVPGDYWSLVSRAG